MGPISILRWRSLALHPLTWLMGLFAGVVLVLITIPGKKWDPYTHDVDHQWHDLACFDAYVAAGGKFGRQYGWNNDGVHVYSHGWPLVAIVRTQKWETASLRGGWSEPVIRFDYPPGWEPVFGPYYRGVSWSNYDNWPFRFDHIDVHYGYLVTNILIIVAMLAGLVAATEWWLRRRGGVFRFRMLDLMVGVAVVAAVLGWRQWHLNCQRTEMEIVNELENRSQGNSWFVVEAFSTGPEWLMRLVGNEEFVPASLRHVMVAEFALLGSDEIRQMGKLPYLKGICAGTPLSRAELEVLKEVRGLAYLELYYPGPDETYGERSGLQFLRAGGPTSAEIQVLCQLPIGTLYLRAPALTVSQLEQLAACPKLRILHLSGVDIPPEEIEEFRRRHPHLQVMHYAKRGEH